VSLCFLTGGKSSTGASQQPAAEVQGPTEVQEITEVRETAEGVGTTENPQTLKSLLGEDYVEYLTKTIKEALIKCLCRTRRHQE